MTGWGDFIEMAQQGRVVTETSEYQNWKTNYALPARAK